MSRKHDDEMQCRVCGEYFDKGNLGLVFWHEDHEGEKPTGESPYKSELMNPTEVTGIVEPANPTPTADQLDRFGAEEIHGWEIHSYMDKEHPDSIFRNAWVVNRINTLIFGCWVDDYSPSTKIGQALECAREKGWFIQFDFYTASPKIKLEINGRWTTHNTPSDCAHQIMLTLLYLSFTDERIAKCQIKQ